MTTNKLTVSDIEPEVTGKGGEGGVSMMTNAAFVAVVFPSVPEGASVAVCSKAGNPCVNGWIANRADAVIENLSAGHNNFVGCSSFYPGKDGSFKAQGTVCRLPFFDAGRSGHQGSV